MNAFLKNQIGQVLLETLWILVLTAGVLMAVEWIFRHGLLQLQRGL